MRKFPEDKIFGDWNRVDRSYNAFEKDIAVATFFFPRHTATELVKAPKMSTLDFLSQVIISPVFCLDKCSGEIMEIVEVTPRTCMCHFFSNSAG